MSPISLTIISLGVENVKLNDFTCLSSCIKISFTAEWKWSLATMLRFNLIDEESSRGSERVEMEQMQFEVNTTSQKFSEYKKKLNVAKEKLLTYWQNGCYH